jgi:hypothetical protein
MSSLASGGFGPAQQLLTEGMDGESIEELVPNLITGGFGLVPRLLLEGMGKSAAQGPHVPARGNVRFFRVWDKDGVVITGRHYYL